VSRDYDPLDDVRSAVRDVEGAVFNVEQAVRAVHPDEETVLVACAASVAAGIWAGDGRKEHGYKPHHDADVRSVARVSVDQVMAIREVVRARMARQSGG
jgi:hypothetical protein